MATIPTNAFGLTDPHLQALKFTGEYGDLFGQSKQAEDARKFFSQPGVDDPVVPFSGDTNKLPANILDQIKETPTCGMDQVLIKTEIMHVDYTIIKIYHLIKYIELDDSIYIVFSIYIVV